MSLPGGKVQDIEVERPTDQASFDQPNERNYQTTEDTEQNKSQSNAMKMRISSIWNRSRYEGSLLFNVCAFILPALYGTLSKLWVANIDSSQVVTTDIYTYIGVIVEVINEGLPRASWVIIGDKSSRSERSRLQIAHSLIVTQMVLGLLLSIIFLGAATRLAAAFVPEAVRNTSLEYIRISSFSALASATEYSVSLSTRALDRPDVPLLISSTKFMVNIILDFILISKFHIPSVTPTVRLQAIIRLSCDLVSSFAGLAYFIYRNKRAHRHNQEKLWPSISALKVLLRPGFFTFTESAVRNALYLWLVHGIISMSADYATAWGVFNTIRWGLIMVPVQALEASTLAFVGHRWGSWRAINLAETPRIKATKRDLLRITSPAFKSIIIALIVEVPLCIYFSFGGARSFAYWLSNSESVAKITGTMWKTIDWCYIFYAVSTQMAAILLASIPRWYLYQSLASNLLWVLPWCIAVTKLDMTAETAWRYHSIVFGGSLVVSFFIIMCADAWWAWKLLYGRMKLPPVTPVDG